MARFFASILTAVAVLWATAILVVPSRIHTADAPLLAVVVYGAGTLVCHQRPERSFHFHGVQLPVCARCAGLYVSGALGALAGWAGSARRHRHVRALLAAVAAPTALTLIVEWAGLAFPSNVVRAAAAIPLGAVAGCLFVRMLRAEAPRSTWAMIG